MPVVGAIEKYGGNVTTLNAIAALPARRVEENLGYGRGRLSQGYCILLLKQKLTPDDFEFEGTTLRSGGRAGLPADNIAADRKRRRVHDDAMAEYGGGGYRALQTRALLTIPLTGASRIAKVLPTIRHNDRLTPSEQYPMGGGFLQWTLKRPCDFLVAAFVDETGFAHTKDLSLSLRDDEPHVVDNRMRIFRYLESA